MFALKMKLEKEYHFNSALLLLKIGDFTFVERDTINIAINLKHDLPFFRIKLR